MKNLRLKSARAAKDLSQQQLAELVGVSRQTIAAGGLTVNDEKVTDAEYRIAPEMLEGEGVVVRKGKKTYHKFVLKG